MFCEFLNYICFFHLLNVHVRKYSIWSVVNKSISSPFFLSDSRQQNAVCWNSPSLRVKLQKIVHDLYPIIWFDCPVPNVSPLFRLFRAIGQERLSLKICYKTTTAVWSPQLSSADTTVLEDVYIKIWHKLVKTHLVYPILALHCCEQSRFK